MIRWVILSGVTILLLVSCSVPVYNRAEITTGPSLIGGLAVSTGWTGSGTQPVGNIRPPYLDYYSDILGTLGFRYGLSERLGLVFQGSVGTGRWLTEPEESSYKPIIYDVQVGAQVRTSRQGALLFTLGYPSIADLKYLHDFNRYLTAGIGIGTRGVALDLIGNLPLNQKLTLFLSGNVTSGLIWLYPDPFPAFSLGAGIGFHP